MYTFLIPLLFLLVFLLTSSQGGEAEDWEIDPSELDFAKAKLIGKVRDCSQAPQEGSIC